MAMERKLVAILSADVQGYSRLMNDDEDMTVRTLTDYRAVMECLIQQHRGRVVDSPGDNLLAEFASVVDAVQCAVAVQRALNERNTDLPANRAMAFRIGINLGDVVVEGERIYGDGVNMAARLEGLAEAGGICISGTVYEQVEAKLDLPYEFLGEQEVKNIAKPIRVYRIEMPSAATALTMGWKKRTWPKRHTRAALATLAVLIGLLGGVAAWQGTRHGTVASHPIVAEPPQVAVASDTPAIAVLPFDNLSADATQTYFSAGMTQDLITDLSKHADVSVIARRAAFVAKEQAVQLRQMGQVLGVQYVLEGSVRKANNRIRITAQLVHATTGHYLWADRYDRDLHDVFALQDEITQKIVAALVETLGQPAYE